MLFSGIHCEKEANRKLLNAYFRYDANGDSVNIKQGILLNENTFECNIIGDTALQVIISKIYEGAGFSIKDPDGIKDGTYVLNEKNTGYYLHPKDLRRYVTNQTSTGSITIKKGTFQAKTLLNTLEATFNFVAADTLTGKTVAVTNGKFLMELNN